MEGRDRLRWVAVRKDLCASDASACARPDEAEDVVHLRLEGLAVGDAGRLAGRERGVREQDASCRRAHRLVLSAQRDAVAEPCTRGAARSAEQSYAAQAAAADPQSPEVRRDAAELAPLEALTMWRPEVVRERLAQLSKRPGAARDAATEARLQMASRQRPKQPAFPQARIRLEAVALARAPKVQQAVARQRAEPALRPEVQQQRASLQPAAEAQDVLGAPRPLPSFA